LAPCLMSGLVSVKAFAAVSPASHPASDIATRPNLDIVFPPFVAIRVCELLYATANYSSMQPLPSCDTEILEIALAVDSKFYERERKASA